MCQGGCKGKCGCNVTTITKGEKGDTGAQGPAGNSGGLVQFKSVEEITPDSTYNFNSDPLTSAGDYIIMFEANTGTVPGASAHVETSILKNAVLDTSNVNFFHQLDLTIDNTNRFTYTHTAKVTGLTVGQTIGIRIEANVFIDNCSITIFKLP